MKTYHATKEDDGFYTATSSSDSESDTPRDAIPEKTNLKGNFQSTKHEHRSTNQEVVDLKQKLAHLSEEKESLNTAYTAMLTKAQETEGILQKLQDESKKLQEKLGEKESELFSLSENNKLQEKEASDLIKELQARLNSLNFQLESVSAKKRQLEEQVESEARAVKQLQLENSKLQVEVLDLEKIIKEKDAQLSVLLNKIERIANSSASEVNKMDGLMAQVNDLKLKLNPSHAQEGEAAEEMAPESQGDTSLHGGLVDQINKMKDELESTWKRNTELECQIIAKTREISGYVTRIENLENELASRSIDFKQILHEKEGSIALVKDLKLEKNNLQREKGELEGQMGGKGKENAHLRQEMQSLQGKMFILEKTLEERDDQFVALQKLETGEDDKSAQIVALTTQINHLQEELELKLSMEEQHKTKNQEIKMMLTGEKELLQKRISELEKRLEDRGDEFSVVQNDMSTKIGALTREVSHLQKEMDLKRKMDDLVRAQDSEINQLREEKETLQGRMLEFEITLTEREDQISGLQRKLQDREKEASARVASLAAQINGLQKEMSNKKVKSLERLTQMENQNTELLSKIGDQHVILKQQEDTMNRLREDCKLIKGRFLQAADGKIDEMAAEFRKNFEDKLRILGQRIRVAEQLHAENKESSKKMQEKCEQEHSGLEKRVIEYSKIIETNKAEVNRISEAANEIMTEMYWLDKKFGNEQESFIKRLSRISDELQITKNWVGSTINEITPSKADNISSNAPADDKRQDKVLKEKMEKLEAKVNKEKGDKIKLMRGMYELQKKVMELEKVVVEKDAGLVRLGEEKVEAIRQLCIWIDYHQSRCNYLKEVLLLRKSKSRGTA
ncbi:hypothetical protein Ancab_032790 [Ancistrocladus abbreviatus]